jgi:hypothetical protein
VRLIWTSASAAAGGIDKWRATRRTITATGRRASQHGDGRQLALSLIAATRAAFALVALGDRFDGIEALPTGGAFEFVKRHLLFPFDNLYLVNDQCCRVQAVDAQANTSMTARMGSAWWEIIRAIQLSG